MKKVISTVAALGLVAGLAGTASALDFSVKGKYIFEGYYLDNASGSENSMRTAFGNLGFTAAQMNSLGVNNGGFDPYNDEASSDAAWVHTFIIQPEIAVNDKIKMVSEIRLAKDQDWGSQDDLQTADGGNVDVHKLYMEYLSPVGKVRMGRTPAGAWAGDFVSTSTHANRLMWWPNFVNKPFSLLFFLQKSTENDWYDGDSDSDNDLYEASIDYKTDGMLLKLAYDYFDYKGNSDAAATDVLLTAAGAQTVADAWDTTHHRIKGYGDMLFGAVYVETEFSYDWGDYRDFDNSANQDIDIDTFAFMLDVGTQMDKLDVGMMYFYASGQDDDDDNEINAALYGIASDGTGDDFNPYYILTGDHTGMLNSDEYNDDIGMAWSGVHCIGVHADFQVSDKLTLHGALAYAQADDTGFVEAMSGVDVDDEYGWEIDLGARYKLLDNLTYEVRAGYFDTGDYFEDLSGDDAEDLMLLSHHLTMSF